MADPRYLIADGEKPFTGYLALPPSGSGPGVLVLQEVYGVNADIRAFADRLAEAGFVALAPDVFWRAGEGLKFAYAERAQAAEVLKGLGGADGLFPDVPVALAALQRHPAVTGKVGVLGVGFGSVLAIKAIGNGLATFDAGVTIHGGRVEDLAFANDAPWQFHLAEEDKVLPADLIEKTKAAYAGRPEKEIFTYAGAPHGFAVFSRPEYDQAAGSKALERTVSFFETALGVTQPEPAE